jgi:CRISPR system Cascade subunit CasD
VKHLLCQIAAPMASFGNESARRDRPTDDHMRKSGFLGLLGAAAGKTRADPWHSAISQALGFAVMVLRPGKRMVDYHVVLSPTGPKTYGTRREEVEASDYTSETYREYLTDFPYFVAAVWQHPRGPGAELDLLARALESPVFEVYVGRKCCTLGLPLAPRILDTPTLADAFRAYNEVLYKPLIGDEKTFRIHWEDHPESGLTCTGIIQRRDELVDRQRWDYRFRAENEGSITL